MRQRVSDTKKRLQEKVKGKSRPSGWVLPRQTTSFADEGTWTNVDSDVTPLDRRTWTSVTVIGFWFSDALNAQGWEAPSSILQLGLTWKEAFYLCKYLSSCETLLIEERGQLTGHRCAGWIG